MDPISQLEATVAEQGKRIEALELQVKRLTWTVQFNKLTNEGMFGNIKAIEAAEAMLSQGVQLGLIPEGWEG